MKYTYFVKETKINYWKLAKYYPLSKQEAETCIKNETRKCKIGTWDEALKIQRIRK